MNQGLTKYRISHRFNKRVPKEEVLASANLLEKIVELLQEDLDSNLREMRKLDNYDTHNWDKLMADHLATQRTLNKVIEILTIKEV